jgi:hypothetical protein
MKCAGVTDHGRRRIRQRIGAPGSAARDLAERALCEGLRIDETVGQLHGHLCAIQAHSDRGTSLRVFRGRVWLYRGASLITVLPLPGRLAPHVKTALERREKGRAA